MHHKAHVGHLGGNFSCIDTLITLYHLAMRPGDDLVLSKGHAAGALYVSLWTLGRLSDEALETFAQDGSTLSGHPSAASLPEILFSTGSLGHGPALAAGLALAARHRNADKRVYCLCSDGEWQEGSCWESLTFATHQQLDQLVILIDQNGWQGFGRTRDVISCDDLAPRIAAFGARVVSVDGHDPAEIAKALRAGSDGKPMVIVLRTRKGHRLHFEDTLESHYLPLTEAQYADARAAIQDGIVR